MFSAHDAKYVSYLFLFFPSPPPFTFFLILVPFSPPTPRLNPKDRLGDNEGCMHNLRTHDQFCMDQYGGMVSRVRNRTGPQESDEVSGRSSLVGRQGPEGPGEEHKVWRLMYVHKTPCYGVPYQSLQYPIGGISRFCMLLRPKQPYGL